MTKTLLSPNISEASYSGITPNPYIAEAEGIQTGKRRKQILVSYSPNFYPIRQIERTLRKSF